MLHISVGNNAPLIVSVEFQEQLEVHSTDSNINTIFQSSIYRIPYYHVACHLLQETVIYP